MTSWSRWALPSQASALTRVQLAPNAWQIDAENQLAHKLGTLQLCFAKNLVFNLSDCTALYPRRFALLASAAEGQTSCLEELKALRAAFDAASATRMPDWQKACKRSHLQQTVAQEILDRLSQVGSSSVPDDVYQYCCQANRHFMSTHMTGDSFHYIKAQVRRSSDSHICASRSWQVPTEKRILSKNYKFTEVSMEDARMPEPKSSVDKAVFEPWVCTASIPRLAPIIGRSSWPVFWPPEEHHRVAEERVAQDPEAIHGFGLLEIHLLQAGCRGEALQHPRLLV